MSEERWPRQGLNWEPPGGQGRGYGGWTALMR